MGLSFSSPLATPKHFGRTSRVKNFGQALEIVQSKQKPAFWDSENLGQTSFGLIFCFQKPGWSWFSSATVRPWDVWSRSGFSVLTVPSLEGAFSVSDCFDRKRRFRLLKNGSDGSGSSLGQGKALAVWILAGKLPKSDLNFAVDFGVDVLLPFFKGSRPLKKKKST